MQVVFSKLRILLILVVVRCMGSAGTVSPIQELLGKLDRAENASTLEAQRRDIKPALEALLEAPKEVLLGAMSEAIRHADHPYARMQEMLIKHCAERYPEEAIARLEDPGSWQARAEATWQVWSVVARTDPERAMTAALAFFDLKHDGDQVQLYASRPVHFIPKAVGQAWFRRDGVAALKKLGSLPHADEIDGTLFEGMCTVVTRVDDCLALLDWFVGPGKHVARSDKGYDLWWERPLRIATAQDPTKAKAWMERTFPPKAKRKSNQDADWFISDPDWDSTHLRPVFFEIWAKTNPLEAADWYVAQFADEDRRSAMFTCLQTLCDPDADLAPGLRWLGQFRGASHFVDVAASAFSNQSMKLRDDTQLKQVTDWLTTLPAQEREKIIIASQDVYDGFHVLFSATMDDKILRGAFPVDTERKAVVERLKLQLKPEQFADGNDLDKYNLTGNEFLLPARKPEYSSNKEALDTAARLAGQYSAVMTADSPTKRLAGVAALDWLAVAPTEKLREILRAHLESTEVIRPAQISPFAQAILEAWVIKDWRACEQFAWESKMTKRIRRALLIETFKAAALLHPDEVYARLKTLEQEQRFWSGALREQGSKIGWFGGCAMDSAAENAGAAWIRQPAGVEKLKALPAVWQARAIAGAAGAFDNATTGVALLNWLQEIARTTDSRAYHREVTTILDRLVGKDERQAVEWIESHPNDPHIDSAFAAMVDHWKTDKPPEAAKMLARMHQGEMRTRRAAELYQSWSRLDENAAKAFLDSVIGVDNTERTKIDAEVKRLEQYAFDRRK